MVLKKSSVLALFVFFACASVLAADAQQPVYRVGVSNQLPQVVEPSLSITELESTTAVDVQFQVFDANGASDIAKAECHLLGPLGTAWESRAVVSECFGNSCAAQCSLSLPKDRPTGKYSLKLSVFDEEASQGGDELGFTLDAKIGPNAITGAAGAKDNEPEPSVQPQTGQDRAAIVPPATQQGKGFIESLIAAIASFFKGIFG